MPEDLWTGMDTFKARTREIFKRWGLKGVGEGSEPLSIL